MKLRAGAVVASILTLAATDAAACMIMPGSQPNMFEARKSTPFADEVARAASIEWVVAEAPMQRVCKRETGIGARERGFWRFVHGAAEWFNLGGAFAGLLTRWPGGEETGTCDGKPVKGPIAPMRARVVERIKGGGPKTFPMWSRYRVEAEEWTGFGESRLFGEREKAFVATYLDTARARHGGPAFLDHGVMRGLWATETSCGMTDQVVEAGRRYLVLRDADGAVLAAEPVLYADDELLVRLRRAKGRPELFRRVEWPVERFVRASRGAAVYRITACGKDQWGPNVGVVLERGDADAGRMWSAGPETWLADQLEATGQRCRAGDRVLVLASPFDTGEGSPYPRAAIIRDGRIRTADLLTPMILTGPSEIAVDQILSWIAEAHTVI